MDSYEMLLAEIKRQHEELTARGELVSREKLNEYFTTFRNRFGLDQLAKLDGEALLETMHGHGSHDSLVYWLEFKNDEEFPGTLFGSIAGGSAYKFGLFKRQEDGVWTTGTPQNSKEISVDEAVQIARRHREQLEKGAALLEKLPVGASNEEYRHLQEEMDRLAPDVSTKSWGHKYFYLLYPDKLDDLHNESYQQYHLIKLLQVPIEGNGRYLNAGRFMSIARELGIPAKHLTEILYKRNNNPHRYWRLRANYQIYSELKNSWDDMRKGGFAAMTWVKLGDLSGIERNAESRKRLQSMMKKEYNGNSWAGEIYSFVAVAEEGDLVVAFEENTILGIGRFIGPYTYDITIPAIPHHRAVEWLSEEQWKFPNPESKSRVFRELKDPRNLVEIEKHLIAKPTTPPPPPPLRLSGILGRIQSILERKRQVILYGPPGTGKTFWARRAALDLAAAKAFRKRYEELSDDQKNQIYDPERTHKTLVRMCTFHPAYGYEDFIEGYRPEEIDGNLVFRSRDGIFKRICEDAQHQPDKSFFLIIDEINRGDIPRIFGELLTILEKDKRGLSMLLPQSGAPFKVPENLYVIGTMNTADRSIALLDTALRRRFGFIELMPDTSVLGETMIGGSIPLGPWLDALNRRIVEHIGRDARNLQVGHAYLMDNDRSITDFARFARIVQDEIIPLLEEYCYEDYNALSKILGKMLVDEDHQQIRYDLFLPAKRDELIQALLAPSPEIATSARTTLSEAEYMASEDGEAESESPELEEEAAG